MSVITNWRELPSEDLLSVIGNVSMEGHCDREYWRWENSIATPALQAAGYVVLRWVTIDGDSFGPLMRGVIVKKGEDKKLLTYG